MVFGQVTNERGGERFGAGKKEAMKAQKRDAKIAQGRETKNFAVSFDDLEGNADAVRYALEDGRLTLADGLEGSAYGTDVGALEERLFALIRNEVPLDYLNDADKQVAFQILEDIAEGPDSAEEAKLVARGLEQLGHGEIHVNVPEAESEIAPAVKPEFESKLFELKASEAQDEAVAVEKANDIKQTILATVPGSMTRRVDLKSVEPLPSLLGADGNDVDHLLAKSTALGLGDLGYKSGRELQRAIEYFDKQEARITQLKNETGFFGRLFGSKKGRELSEALAERRLMQDRFDRIQTLAIENRGISGRNKQETVGGNATAQATPVDRAKERTRERTNVEAKVKRF